MASDLVTLAFVLQLRLFLNWNGRCEMMPDPTLKETRMANHEHLAKLKEGVEAWNRWRSEEQGRPDLSGAHLSYAKLSGVDLGGADLRHTNLVGADLSFANLRNANLSRANLSRANLIMANLKGAVINDANLTGANTFGVVRRFVGWLFGKRRRSGRKSSRGSVRSRGHRVA